MKQRTLSTGDVMLQYNSGTTSLSIDSQASRAFSPMKNKDIERATVAHSWLELEEKARRQQQSFRNRFYR